MAKELSEDLSELLESDEDVREWLLVGRLPSDFAEIAATALKGKINMASAVHCDGLKQEFKHAADLIQQKYFPNAPQMERGGVMQMLNGGHPPAWVISLAIAVKLQEACEGEGAINDT